MKLEEGDDDDVMIIKTDDGEVLKPRHKDRIQK